MLQILFRNTVSITAKERTEIFAAVRKWLKNSLGRQFSDSLIDKWLNIISKHIHILATQPNIVNISSEYVENFSKTQSLRTM